ncbi:MAG: hypothetical protein IJ529_01590 [Alphaproteobacteria bacterium]|nr:hypothetical protein [Alphaproteobacteria bacterium]MBR1600237.1 hypothetical protein [Alphaproteobacteria bacterium]
MSKREQVLNALFARLSVLPDVKVKRNAVLPVFWNGKAFRKQTARKSHR